MTDQRAAIAGVFDRASEMYDGVGVEFFSTVGRELVELAQLQPGEDVLDVGCGRGAALFPAAEVVGPSGSVMGIDLAPGMVERTAAVARERGLDHVRLAVMDAQEPELDASSYDAVLSSLVVFFLPDPLAGLRSWRAAARDSGRLALTTFTGRDDERWAWLGEVFPDRSPRATKATDSDRDEPDDPGPFSSADRLHALLADAGWVGAQSHERNHDVTFADDDQWIAWSWSHGMRRHWEKAPENEHDALIGSIRRHLATMRAEHGRLELRMRVRYTTAVSG